LFVNKIWYICSKKSRHASNQSKTKIDTLEAEIKKLETDIEVMKSVHDINDSRTGYNEPDNASLVSSIQAPQPEQTAIGEVISELKVRNQVRAIQKARKNKEGTHTNFVHHV
jgi:hypothetical protein